MYAYIGMYAFEHGAITFTDHNRSSNIAPTTKFEWEISLPLTHTHTHSISIERQHSECISIKKKSVLLWCICKNPHQHHICIYCAMAKHTLQTSASNVSVPIAIEMPRKTKRSHIFLRSQMQTRIHTSNLTMQLCYYFMLLFFRGAHLSFYRLARFRLAMSCAIIYFYLFS